MILPACLGSDDVSPPLDRPEPERRYVRTVAPGGEARLDPSGALPVSGRVLTPQGRPAPGVSVVVERDEYGLFPRLCLIGCTLNPCDVRIETVTGPDGRFTAGLCKRAGRELSVLVSSPGSTADVHLPVYWKGARTLLPVLRLWTPRVDFDRSSGTVSWRHLPTRGYGALDRYEMGFRPSLPDGDFGDAVWFRFIAQPPEILDRRVLEDTAGEIFVTAYTKVRLRPPCRPSCRRVFRPSFTSVGVPYEGPGAPPSRGRPCFVGDPRGRRIDACYLTDGDFSRSGWDYACSDQLGCGAEPRWVGVDLGASRRIELVVARGCDFCRVSVSSDGRRWAEVRSSDWDDSLSSVSVHALTRPRPVRYVRVTDPEHMIELSYW